VKLCHGEEPLYSTPQILNHCSIPSSIHSYPTTTAGFKIRSILPTQKSNTPGGLKHETQSTDIPPPPCIVWDQNGHIIVQMTSHQLQLQSPGCAPMAVFVGFLVGTVAMEQVLLWVLQFSLSNLKIPLLYIHSSSITEGVGVG